MRKDLPEWQTEIIRTINEYGVEDNELLPPMDPLGAYADDDPETHRRLHGPLEGSKERSREPEEEAEEK